ncbi:hypothetical protein V7O66_03145 [Methanolobus sp. ZRKC3]|uniref:hypothetical protein n=1 Tax=Methanolobus sp. ZRKC3 TaxID=3125786 RepID=UPI003255D47D
MGIETTYEMGLDAVIYDGGNTFMACPECEKEIEFIYNNIVDKNLVRGSRIACPGCNSEIDRVLLSKEGMEQVMDRLWQGAMVEINEMLK